MNTALQHSHPVDIAARPTRAERAISVQHTSKFFGGSSSLFNPFGKPKKRVSAVDDISFDIRRGEIYGVLGANGSGKSTLIRLIATLLLPDAGKIEIFGHDVEEDAATVRRMLNRVSVEASLFKKLSAMENLMYAARLYSIPASTARRDIVRILTRLNIPETRIGQPVERMSRGMQQKVSIARALLTSPVVLLLDEPTTGLDPRSKKDVQEYILEVREEHDATVLLTSHDMDEADGLCDRLAILNRGQIVVEGTPESLKESHARVHGLDQIPSLEDVFMEVTGRGLDDEESEE